MANRTAKFVSALFASVLASGNLTVVSNNSAYAADDSCLSAPKASGPEGAHWYYRIDRATKKHCWYIRNEKEKVARAAPQDAATQDAVAPSRQAVKRAAVADAHAELPMPQARGEPDAGVTAAPRVPAPIANAPAADNQAVNAPDTGRPQSAFIFASRWPENSGSSSVNPAPADGRNASQQPTPAVPPAAPPTATIKLAAADASSEKPSGSIQMLLIVIVGALSVAGLIGSAIFKFGRARPAKKRRRAIWDSMPADHSLPEPYPMPHAHLPRADLAQRDLATEQPSDRVADMLARLARSAQT